MNQQRSLTSDAPARAMQPASEERPRGIPHSDETSLASIYHQRAAALACPPPKASAKTGHDRVVLFQLGDERYGLPMSILDRIFAKPVRTHVPGVGSRWAGVFAVQGEIVPILHLAHILDLPGADTDPGEHVLTLRMPGRKLGLLVGRVLEILKIPAESLRLAGNQAHYLKGVSPDNALVLDIDLLTAKEFLP